MSNGISLDEFEGHLVAQLEEADARERGEGSFHVALFADWSGRVNRELTASGTELADWRSYLVDRDNLDEVMERLGVALRLPVSADQSEVVNLQFNNLDDFHPDAIFRNAEYFQPLRKLRSSLRDRDTFRQAAQEVRARFESEETGQTAKPESKTTDDQTTTGSLLDRVLATTEPSSGVPQDSGGVSPHLNDLVRKLVEPYLMPDDLEQDALISAVDQAISKQMRWILHHKDFQALEAGWRALHLLASKVETSGRLSFHLFDISRLELANALAESADVEETGIRKLLERNASKHLRDGSWSVLAGNYVFDLTATDAQLLTRLSTIANRFNAPFIAEAAPAIVGCKSFGETPDPESWKITADASAMDSWAELRSVASSRYLGLALPRFLLRLPYGRDTDPIEGFAFDEMPTSQHDSYLWGNPVFLLVYVLSSNYSDGDLKSADGENEISSLPLHVYEEDAETVIKPCAEIVTTITAVEKFRDSGLIPIVWMKDTDTVRIGGLQSIVKPATPLWGSWK